MAFVLVADFNRPISAAEKQRAVLLFQLGYKIILSFKRRDHSLHAKSSINRAALLRVCQAQSIPLSGRIALHF